MTNQASSILDPVTGLPLDQYSGIVQQIPLGQQVFPFADLDADGRMTRQPIYGDDVLPTTSLITGQDTTGAARAGTMDTARRLYTREAVFQNLGQPIPDGETAPVDVNVVSGGGGGGGSNWGYSTGYAQNGLVGFGLQPFDTIIPAPTKIFSFIGVAFGYAMSTAPGGYNEHFTIGYGPNSTTLTVPLFTDILAYDPNIPQMVNAYARWSLTFPGGLPVLGTYSNADPFTIYTDSPSFRLDVAYTVLYV